MDDAFAFGRVEQQRSFVVPAKPAMVNMKTYAALAQPPHPSAQQWRSFTVARKHAPGAADVGLDSEFTRPCAQRIAVEGIQPVRELWHPFAVARVETGPRLTVGEVEAALAGDQKLAPD